MGFYVSDNSSFFRCLDLRVLMHSARIESTLQLVLRKNSMLYRHPRGKFSPAAIHRTINDFRIYSNSKCETVRSVMEKALHAVCTYIGFSGQLRGTATNTTTTVPLYSPVDISSIRYCYPRTWVAYPWWAHSVFFITITHRHLLNSQYFEHVYSYSPCCGRISICTM